MIESTAADGKSAEEVIFRRKEEEESVGGLAWGSGRVLESDAMGSVDR